MRPYSLVFVAIGMVTGLYRVATYGPPHNAADFASRMQNLVGTSHGPSRMRSVAAEGNTLVFTIDGALGWRQGMPSYAMTAYFIDGVCEQAKAAGYFAEGRTLRLDSMEDGAHLIHGAPLDHCPAPVTRAPVPSKI